MKRPTCCHLMMIVAGIAMVVCRSSAAPPTSAPAISSGRQGKLIYAADDRGNRVPDFSYCGYRGGDAPIPDVPVRVVVPAPAADADSTAIIQAAIDQVAAMEADKDGLRGAVLLEKGRYNINGQLRINAPGVVLRGHGAGDDGTILVATGLDRRPLITIGGIDDLKAAGSPVAISDKYIPVNATSFRVAGSPGLKVGDTILIRRPSTKQWIETMGMSDLGGDRHGPSWREGSRDVVWDRTITAVHAENITIDAPLTAALDSNFGGGTIATYNWPGRIRNAGVENLSCESTYDKSNPKDEDHAWYGVTMENAADAWVRQVNFRHFTGSAVAVWSSCRRVTVEDCKSLSPVGEIGGWRRDTFFTTASQVLMQRLYSEDGRHDFAVGFAAPGPNAFVQCESKRSTAESGGIDSWSCGTLFDLVRIDGAPLSLRNRMYQSQGSGWSAANSLMWNCSAPVIECWKPPTAQNWAFGTWGEFSGTGEFSGSNDSANPDSLYYAQLADRIGPAAKERAQLLIVATDASSNPTPAVAAELAKISLHPMPQLSDFIDAAAKRNPIPTSAEGAVNVKEAMAPASQPSASHILAIKNGWVIVDGALLTGGRMGVPWWNGSIRPADLEKAQPALTRFVPGRTGRGLTDDLSDVARQMTDHGIIAVEQHPPLWYDRRRDDHERIRRMDGDVVAPFYEWPYARSGQSSAWDGLSKWDLTKYNPWYFARLQRFADLASQNKLVLFNLHYLQHSILEAGAHYADFPWRTANNINNTGFPEPPYYVGDKRIFIGEQFYDTSNAIRADIHRKYIRHQLDVMTDKTNVVHLTSEEYTGSLAFVQFWLDTIAEWKREHPDKHPLIGLYATKDVQDAILADPERAGTVSLIYNRYNIADDSCWWYQPDGTLYAPKGGINLSPRQNYRLALPKNAGFDQIVRAVREYRTKYPDKPFVYVGESRGANAWATLIGGGSLAEIAGVSPELLRAIVDMRPIDIPNAAKGQYALGDAEHGYLIYSTGAPTLPKDADSFARQYVDMRTGRVSDTDPGGQQRLLWLAHRQTTERK